MKAAPTVQPLLTFGQCLKNILGARKLSASALSRMMEQKSRNSMFRILDDTGGPAVQAAFFESLKASDCLHLTEQEERELERALEVSRFGVAGYMTNQAMHRLLGDVDLQAAADDSLRVDRSRDGSVTTLRESMERLAAGQKRVHFVITGCCHRRVFECIAAAFAGSACEMSIEHYLYTGGDEIIGCVSAIQPVLYLPDYKGYCIDENMFNIQREQVYRCNTITAHCEDAQGQKQVLMAVMIDPQRLLSIGLPDERNVEIVERMMREDRPKMHPINFVAPEVLVGPARDGFAAHGFAQDDALEEMIGQFYKVHQKRFDNYFQKRRPTHAIFSRQAMEQFALTGLESDHFFAIRPFSPAERVAILTHLKEQNETNPNFCLYFFKPGYRQPRTEICLYEGAGTMLTVADTDYDLSGAHSEVLITQTEFSRKYKAFFIHDLLESKVLSPAETQRTFEELIEIARNA